MCRWCLRWVDGGQGGGSQGSPAHHSTGTQCPLLLMCQTQPQTLVLALLAPPLQAVLDGNGAGETPRLPLRGYLVGNGVADEQYDGNALVPFAYGKSLIRCSAAAGLWLATGLRPGTASWQLVHALPTCFLMLKVMLAAGFPAPAFLQQGAVRGGDAGLRRRRLLECNAGQRLRPRCRQGLHCQ
jgi:hypothetical protein